MSNGKTECFDPRRETLVDGASGGVLLALAIAGLAFAAITIEGTVSLRKSLSEGLSLPQALFDFFRYFTILTNLAVAALMTTTVARRHRSLPPAALYLAVSVYAVMTGVTYELLLRGQWSPRGMQFDTDLAMHDLVPALTLLFWFFHAPKQALRWRDAAWLLVFPVAYFALTLGAGALGADYPYDFLDVDSLGYRLVLAIAVAFLAVFYATGLLLIGVARVLARRRPARSPTAAAASSEPG